MAVRVGDSTRSLIARPGEAYTNSTDSESRFRFWKDLVNAQLQCHVPEPSDSTDLVGSAMHYSVKGGHRWRPILLISAYEACAGRSAADVLDAACSIEIVHCCTLMLDDLPAVDNSTCRRGKPSCHAIYGEAITTYASHLVYALAERLSFENAETLGADEKLVWRRLAELRERLVEAQVIELNLSKGTISALFDTLTNFYELKSSPFTTAAWLAATLGKVEATIQEGLTQYAEYLGIAYQLADDIADVGGDTLEMGKPLGMDQNKINFVTVLGPNGAKELARQYMEKAQRELDVLPFDTESLSLLIKRIVGPVVTGSPGGAPRIFG